MIAPLIVVAIGCAILLGTFIARRLPVPGPVVLVVLGALLAAVPHLNGVGLPPEAVLFVFLPLLLYWESLSTSAREIRRFLRAIILNGTLLVVVTAAAVAGVLHLLGVPSGPAWLIGAALAPTDATAVASLGRGLPRRNATVLQAESLINDGTALVIFALAMSVATGNGSVTVGRVALLSVISFGGGLVVGLAGGWLMYQIRRRLRVREGLNLASVMTPFVVYLAAELIHASGVLAVVTTGLFMARVTPRTVAARVRIQGESFWSLATFALNGALFVLVGLALPATVRGLATVSLPQALLLVLVTFVTLVAVRYLFVQLSVVLIRALDRRPQQRELRTSARYRVVHAIAGFRGGVSLAMALSIPVALAGGAGFPSRDLIVFVTGLVVVLTLAVQGPLLPLAIRWAKLPPDEAVNDELREAQEAAIDAALDALPRLAKEAGASEAVVDRARTDLETHRDALAAEDDDEGSGSEQAQARELQLALLGVKRATVIGLRDQGRIDDTVLRRIQSVLDIEEVRARGPVPAE